MLADMRTATLILVGVVAGWVSAPARAQTGPRVLRVSSVAAAAVSQDLAQSEGSVYRNDTLQLMYQFPASLHQESVGSFEEAIARGHQAHYAAKPPAEDEQAGTGHCMHVLLYAKTPDQSSSSSAGTRKGPSPAQHGRKAVADATPMGMVTVGEFDPSCVPLGSEPSDMPVSLASIPGQVPGFQPIDPQMWYELDEYKMHFLAAQGRFEGDGQNARPMMIAAAATEVHGHMLFWVFMANSAPMLNQLLNSPVQFDRHNAEPLFPLTIGDGPPVKPIP